MPIQIKNIVNMQLVTNSQRESTFSLKNNSKIKSNKKRNKKNKNKKHTITCQIIYPYLSIRPY